MVHVVLVGTLQTGYLLLQDKTSRRACSHTLSRALDLWTLPPVGIGSDAVTCPTAPDLTSISMWAPALSRVLWLQTSPLG
jgi:hypothetical protein